MAMSVPAGGVAAKGNTCRCTAHLYLDASVDEETLKKVVWHSVATALASIVLPVPGGPKSSTP
jgi:hypothetical protein